MNAIFKRLVHPGKQCTGTRQNRQVEGGPRIMKLRETKIPSGFSRWSFNFRLTGVRSC